MLNFVDLILQGHVDVYLDLTLSISIGIICHDLPVTTFLVGDDI